jgi:hypothetical protein
MAPTSGATGDDVPVALAPSVRDLISAPAPTLCRIPFVCVLTGTHPRLGLDLPNFTAFTNLCRPYESVRLIDFNLSVKLVPGKGLAVDMCVYPANDSPAAGALWQAPVWHRLSCDETSSTEASWSLGADHAFGRELKCASLGNPHPIFRVVLAGAASDSIDPTAILRGSILVSFHGVGVIKPWVITGSKA